MASLIQISIHKLLLDEHNFRTGDTSSQNDAINAIIIDQGIKLVNLAEHIFENGLSPIKQIMVYSAAKKGYYIVADGNRRVLAIKLLLNPDLLEDTIHTNIKNKFSALNSNMNIAFNQIDGKISKEEEGKKIKFNKEFVNLLSNEKTISCVEVTKEEAQQWVYLEHYKGKKPGIGQEAWKSLPKARADKSIGLPNPVLDLLDFAIDKGNIESDVKQDIKNNHFNFSTLERFIKGSTVQNQTGIEIQNDSFKTKKSEAWVLEFLSKIINTIATEKFGGDNFSVRDINDISQAGGIASTMAQSMATPSVEIDEEWTLSIDIDGNPKPENIETKGVAKKSPPKKKKPRKDKWDRTRLIPDECDWDGFEHEKLNRVFKELRWKLTTKEREVAVALTFRTFFEIAIGQYCKDNHINSNYIKKMRTNKQNNSNEITLQERATAVLNHMEQKNLLNRDNVQMTRRLIENQPLSIATEFNIYVHNPNYTPIRQTMHETWDSLTVFFIALCKNL